MPLERITGPAYGVTWYRFTGPDVGADAGFVHALVTRLGGVSNAPFSSLNLGSSVGDAPDAVRTNHTRLFDALGVSSDQVVSPSQVHGRRVAVVGQQDGGTIIPRTDALITNRRGMALLLRFADCVPVLFYDAVHRAAGLAHAGWRGVAKQVIPATVAAMAEQFGTEPQDLWAGVGPAIGLDHYEVGEDVVRHVQATLPPETCVASQIEGQWHLDLPKAVTAQLTMLGIARIEGAEICTACNLREWYSHRGEAGNTGRFGVLVALT
jgi:polyphenol oxidase